MTLSDRVNMFDGAELSKSSGLGILIEPGATHSLTTRFCSANNTEHHAQVNFSGSDTSGARVNLTGPIVILLPR